MHYGLGHDLAHLAECQLATVDRLRSIKRTSKSELARQVRIAQFAVNCFKRYGEVSGTDTTCRCPRLKGVINGEREV